MPRLKEPKELVEATRFDTTDGKKAELWMGYPLGNQHSELENQNCLMGKSTINGH
jgi:hypothetical protein